MRLFHNAVCLSVLLLIGNAIISDASASDVIDVTSRPVEFSTSDNPDIKVTIGELTLLNAVELLSADPRFGGLSGLEISRDGNRWVMVSDRGYLLQGGFERNGEDSAISGINEVSIRELYDHDGKAMNTLSRDAESVTWLLEHKADVEDVVVGFERDDRVSLYSVDSRFHGGYATPKHTIKPPIFSSLPFNKGIESMTLLLGGRLLVVGEGTDSGAWILAGWKSDSVRIMPLHYVYHGEFLPSDMATLPNGDVLVLERRAAIMSGFSIRIVHIPARAMLPNAVIEGREIARMEAPFPIDNMEGISAYRAADGKTHVVLLSDDNYRIWQRTLLMEFEWNQ